jgi:hypothetical protein
MSLPYFKLQNVNLADAAKGLVSVTTDGVAQAVNHTIAEAKELGRQMQASGQLNFKTCEETAKCAPLFRLEHGETAENSLTRSPVQRG